MSLARLLQLASPTLPVGAYSYSQGLEAAIEAGQVTDEASAQAWIADVLEFAVLRMEAPVLWRMLHGEDLNELFLASRETAELRAETVQMGHSLARLIQDLDFGVVPLEEPSYPAAYAFIARKFELKPEEAIQAYLWSWLENQVMAAIKAVPLGQTAGQRMLLALGLLIENFSMNEKMRNFAPGLAFFSTRHETQYSRLFRS
ncbi:MAG TPA: urease accessory UreF family protein [Burkholderiales bacterium]